MDASKASKATFGISPEAFYAIDVRMAFYKFIAMVVNPQMLFVSQIDQPIIASPPIGINDTFDRDTASNDVL